MDFRNRYPDYAEIEHLIRRARAERSVAIAEFIAQAITAAGRGIRSVALGMSEGLALWRTQRGIEAGVLQPKAFAHR